MATGILLRRGLQADLLDVVEGEIVFATDIQQHGWLKDGAVIWKDLNVTIPSTKFAKSSAATDNTFYADKEQYVCTVDLVGDELTIRYNVTVDNGAPGNDKSTFNGLMIVPKTSLDGMVDGYANSLNMFLENGMNIYENALQAHQFGNFDVRFKSIGGSQYELYFHENNNRVGQSIYMVYDVFNTAFGLTDVLEYSNAG